MQAFEIQFGPVGRTSRCCTIEANDRMLVERLTYHLLLAGDNLSAEMQYEYCKAFLRRYPPAVLHVIDISITIH